MRLSVGLSGVRIGLGAQSCFPFRGVDKPGDGAALAYLSPSLFWP